MNNYKHLKFNNLSDFWIFANSQKAPQGFESIRQSNGIPGVFMKPENMMNYLNAYSPFDLYQKPSTFPTPIDYETSAFNYSNPFNNTMQNAIFLASQNPVNRFLPIHGVNNETSNYSDIQSNLHKYIPQGIYEHEVGHFLDPRLLPQKNNYGYMTRYGLRGNIGGRERPGIEAENKFWDFIQNRFKNMSGG